MNVDNDYRKDEFHTSDDEGNLEGKAFPSTDPSNDDNNDNSGKAIVKGTLSPSIPVVLLDNNCCSKPKEKSEFQFQKMYTTADW